MRLQTSFNELNEILTINSLSFGENEIYLDAVLK